MASTEKREARIRHFGNILLASSRSQTASRIPFERLMESMLADDVFRTQVLRFVDVLPSLASDRDLVEHLQEYFASQNLRLPPFFDWALSKAHYSPLLTGKFVRRALLLVAKRFIGAEDSRDALQSIIRMRAQNLGFSLDRLGEAVVSEKEAAHYQQAYLRLIEELAPALARQPPLDLLDRIDGEHGPGLYLSIKLSSLYSQISAANLQGSVDRICDRLRPILYCARSHNAFVCFDMEQYDVRAIILESFKQVLMEDALRDWPHVGIAIQAYLKKSENDIAELVEWAKRRATPVTIRLVRGAYWDYECLLARQQGWEIPVWTQKSETDWNYERYLEFLFDHQATVRTAVATHNLRSIACAMALAEEKRLRFDQFEFQTLYGMALGLQKAIPSQGYCLRVYVPYGDAVSGMAYLVRRLLENSSAQSLLTSDSMHALDPESAMAAPHPPVSHFHPSVGANDSAQKAGFGAFVNEPWRRFTDSREHQSMRSAIARLKGRLGRHVPIRINGEAIQTQERIVSVNPADPAEIIGTVATASFEHAERAMRGARQAFESWSRKTAEERAEILIRAASLLRQRRDDFAALEILEAGKTWTEADANITEAIDFLEFYAREAIRLAAGQSVDWPGEENTHGFCALGVGVVIPPWNFPLAILTGMLSAALVAGNAVILKPSSQTPVIAACFVDLLTEAGLPAGVLQFLPGPGASLGMYLVEHSDTHFVAFTGSEAVGIALIEAAARRRPGQRHVKRVIAEMGGKNAIIVDSDAELDEAVTGIVRSAFGYQGQKCSACSRLIVVGRHFRSLLARLVDAANSLQIGMPEDPAVNFGPLIDALAKKRVQAAIRAGQGAAKLELARDCNVESGGFFVGPTIFSRVPPDSALFQEEIFGPVLSAVQAADLDFALKLANDSRYALTGGFYSRSPFNIERVKREFEVGNLYINRAITGALVSRQPFGGFRMSGVGSKAGGQSYVLQFMNQRSLTENTIRRGFAPGFAKA